MWWLIIPALILLLAITPIGVSLLYDSSGVRLDALIGPLRLHIFPAKKKAGDKKKKPEKKKKASPQKTGQSKSAQTQKGGPITDFLPLAQLVLDFLEEFRRKLRITCIELNLVLGGGDPCDLAINYGKACAALGNVWPRLEEFFVIKKRDVKIQCDFEASQTLVTARLDLSITIGRILSMGVRHGIRVLKEFLNIMNKRKGGATL